MASILDGPISHPLGLLKRVSVVFWETWDLGLTSFGGPPVHFQIFHHRFVEKKRWIDEQTYQELFALCQALPGPASTKLGYCICLTYGGFLPALLQFTLWCLPGAIGMYALAICVSRVPETLPDPFYALLSGMNAATVGVIGVSAVTLSEKAISDDVTRVIVLSTGCAGMLYSALWYFPSLMLAGGAVTLIWDSLKASRKSTYSPDVPSSIMAGSDRPINDSLVTERTPLLDNTRIDAQNTMDNRRTIISDQLTRSNAESNSTHFHYGSAALGSILIATFGLAFLVILILRGLIKTAPVEYKLFSNLFLAGTIIFGGGPVVIPLLSDYIVNEGWVSTRDFLIGLALIQAFPGPNFNFAIFLSALTSSSSLTSPSPLFFAFLGFVGMFSPGMILATGVSALWHTLRKRRLIVHFLRGVNAAAVGLVWTAVYRIWESGYLKPDSVNGASLGESPRWAVVAAAAFSGNRWFVLQPPLVIAIGGAIGILTLIL